MTNPAIDALERIKKALNHFTLPDYIPLWMQCDEDMDTIRTALSNAPEVVTLAEFWDGYDKKRHKYDHPILYVLAEFPNGLKITAAPNGGG